MVLTGETLAWKAQAQKLARETKPGKYADGGARPIIAGPTSKNWSYRYGEDGKERRILVSLAEARLKRIANAGTLRR